MPNILKFVLLGFTALMMTSGGIKKSINHRQDVATYNAAIPDKITVNDSTLI